MLGPGEEGVRRSKIQAATLEQQWGLKQRAADLARRDGWRSSKIKYSKWIDLWINCQFAHSIINVLFQNSFKELNAKKMIKCTFAFGGSGCSWDH